MFDKYDVIKTELGWIYLGITKLGISSIRLYIKKNSKNFEKYYMKRLKRKVERGLVSGNYKKILKSTLQGSQITSPPIDLEGLTQFEQTVLVHLLQIPRGEVRPYSWLAREIGKPRAIRAVGNVMAQNPIPFLLPCHRIVPSNGDIGKYYYGSKMKELLLEKEGLDIEKLTSWKQRGVYFIGNPNTGYYCYPTCQQVFDNYNNHYWEYRTGEEAISDGLQACQDCRPF